MAENIDSIFQIDIKTNPLFPIDIFTDSQAIPGPSHVRKRRIFVGGQETVKIFIGEETFNNNAIKVEKIKDVPKDQQQTDENLQFVEKKEAVSKEQQQTDEQFQFVREIIPDADPNYVSFLCQQFGDNSDELYIKINDLLQNKNYPIIKESIKSQESPLDHKLYTINFNVEAFLNIIPNPSDYFNGTMGRYKIDKKDIGFLHNLFCFIFPSMDYNEILTILKQNAFNFIKSFQTISKQADVICLDNKILDCLYPGDNLPLLQEIAYCFHQDEIEGFLRKRIDDLNQEYLQAEKTNSLNTCQCCFSDDIIPRLTYFCDNGCPFCRDCIVRSAEIAFGEGKLNFPCLTDCESSFNFHTLQCALPSKLFSKILQKRAIADVRAAEIDGLEMCPFCDFAAVLPDEQKVFKCLNAECLKESCRFCKELSHIPLRCNEVEKNEETQARVFIENQMTEALLRECYKCKVKFYKADGCNLMTCSCGAKMCYICKQPVNHYNHFVNQRGTNRKKCPLYSDTNRLHKREVLNRAHTAKQQVADKLKNDPTKDIKKILK